MTQHTCGLRTQAPGGRLARPAAKWTGLGKTTVCRRHNDPDRSGRGAGRTAVHRVLKREGKTRGGGGEGGGGVFSFFFFFWVGGGGGGGAGGGGGGGGVPFLLGGGSGWRPTGGSGAAGYRPLGSEFPHCEKLKGSTPESNATADDILIVWGSLQALDLVTATLLARRRHRDYRRDSYHGRDTPDDRLGVHAVASPRRSGMRIEREAAELADLKAKGITPKFIYNHYRDGAESRRAPSCGCRPQRLLRVADAIRREPVFEDDCYADLIWDGQRRRAVCDEKAETGGVIHIGSFSKYRAGAAGRLHIVAPGLRVRG